MHGKCNEFCSLLNSFDVDSITAISIIEMFVSYFRRTLRAKMRKVIADEERLFLSNIVFVAATDATFCHEETFGFSVCDGIHYGIKTMKTCTKSAMSFWHIKGDLNFLCM